MEAKSLSAVVAEFKFSDGANGPSIEGYGAFFNNVDAGGDLIRPGAFAEFLSQRGNDAPPVPMLYEHDSSRIAGMWTHLAEDGKGLMVKGEFLDTALGRDAAVEVKSRAKSGLSIGYTVLGSTPRVMASDPRRTINKVHLWEVSLATFPMNDKARVLDVKSATPSEIERVLRDAGLSRTEAKALMHGGFDELKRLRDAGESDDEELMRLLKRNLSTLRSR